MRGIAVLFLLTAMTALAQTPEERQHAVDYLQSTREAFALETNGLTDAQAQYKSTPDKWSIVEIAEHITATEAFIFDLLQKKMKDTPSPAAKRDAVRGKEQMIHRAVPNRGRKVNAPEEVRPTGRWATLREVRAEFDKTRQRTIDFVKLSKEDLRNWHQPHFALGDMDVYQWTVFLAAHSERHLAQIREVRGDAGFPGH